MIPSTFSQRREENHPRACAWQLIERGFRDCHVSTQRKHPRSKELCRHGRYVVILRNQMSRQQAERPLGRAYSFIDFVGCDKRLRVARPRHSRLRRLRSQRTSLRHEPSLRVFEVLAHFSLPRISELAATEGSSFNAKLYEGNTFLRRSHGWAS